MSESAEKLLVIAVRQFGAGIVIAAGFAWSTVKVYSDLQKRTEGLFLLVERQARLQAETVSALATLTEEIRNHPKKEKP